MTDSKTVVGIVMGSDSDWPVMRDAAEALTEFGVPFEADVVSAHRMPHEMISYGSEAAGRGLKVIIAGAGGAAHLPGMMAALTPLPVFGIPVESKALSGMDSLLSIVQMPAGIPVVTLAIGRAGAVNAALLAFTDDDVHGVATAFVVVSRMVGMLIGISALTTIGLRRYYAEQRAVPPVQEVCDGRSRCKEFSDLLRVAGIAQEHAVFWGAAGCAVVAGVLALVLFAGARTDQVSARDALSAH